MMRGLSVMQPWASLIVGGPLSPGVKRTENRGRLLAMAARRLVGQRIAIHASKKFDEDGVRSLLAGAFGFKRTEFPYQTLRDFPRGAVVGSAKLDRVFDDYDVLNDDERRFYVGDHGLSLGERRFIEPIACLGALGFWTVPSDIAGKIEAQL
jgi:hypothetical protein